MIIAIIIVGFLVFVRLGFLYDNIFNYEISSKTECPNCSVSVPTLNKGKHSCDECNFEFEVNKQGDSIKYSNLQYHLL